MKMFSCFWNCPFLSKKKEPIVIGGRVFSSHKQKRRGRTYKCDACQQRGFGPYYLCNSDDDDIHYHEHCGDILRRKSPRISNHHPYPVGRYIFKERAPSRVQYCIACGDPVRGLRYKVWSSNPFRNLYNCTFHPLCATLPPQIQDPSGQVVLNLEEGIRGQCPLCKGKAKGWAYNKTCGNYSYHVGCMKNEIIQSWQPGEEASENGGNITIRVEIQIPQIQELAAAAIGSSSKPSSGSQASQTSS